MSNFPLKIARRGPLKTQYIFLAAKSADRLGIRKNLPDALCSVCAILGEMPNAYNPLTTSEKDPSDGYLTPEKTCLQALGISLSVLHI